MALVSPFHVLCVVPSAPVPLMRSPTELVTLSVGVPPTSSLWVVASVEACGWNVHCILNACEVLVSGLECSAPHFAMRWWPFGFVGYWYVYTTFSNVVSYRPSPSRVAVNGSCRPASPRFVWVEPVQVMPSALRVPPYMPFAAASNLAPSCSFTVTLVET